MSVKWTEEQQRVIDLRGSNILVSAAAGSGKTAVLVERIIQRIIDPVHPMDVDRLLVMTYTEAAAAEMKERIGAAIEKKLEVSEGNSHLERQATLVHNASIMTIHSFCLSVIREHFHVIGIDPGFRIAEEGELKLLHQDVLAEMLEEYYVEGNAEFLQFVEKYGTGRNDRKIEGIIESLYEYSRSYPRPDQWLRSCADAYDMERQGVTSGHPDDFYAVQMAKERIRFLLEDCIRILDAAMEFCLLMGGPGMYLDALNSDREMISAALKRKTYQDLMNEVNAFQWKRFARAGSAEVLPEYKEQVQGMRATVKDLVAKLKKYYFYAPVEEWAADMSRTKTDIEVLTRLVNDFAGRLAEAKRGRNMIDFSDMEQFALQILTEEKEGVLVPSAAAKEYQDQFEEVMIDEYQDSNLVQETLLTSVSRVSAGENNIFMVGDVKQSIYRFRLSRPELFMKKFNSYSLEDGAEEQRIDLHKNFRSRREVLDGANYIFKRLMRREFGGIEYDENAMLYQGAIFPEDIKGDLPSYYKTELLLFDKGEILPADAKKAEARMIAQRIKSLMSEGRVMDKATGGYRPVRYSDIVILTRSLKGWAETFSAVLSEEGIPAYAVSRSGYFEAYEVSVLMDYLRLLDNFRQDLPLTAVLTSPFGGLNATELAEIRIAYPEAPFYEAVRRYEEGYEEGSPLQEHLIASGTDAGMLSEHLMNDDDENHIRVSEEHEKDRFVEGAGHLAADSVLYGKDHIMEQTGERTGGSFKDRIREKLRRFFRQYEAFRRKISYTAIHDLLHAIIDETGYRLFITAMPGGEQRLANVEMLIEKATAFEGTSYRGLFHFVRYIEQLKKYDVDYGEAGMQDELSDTVRIMSIHKSKGLEFPIVFVSGLGKQFNMQDVRSEIVLHPEWGIGLDAVDIEKRTKTPTFLKRVIQRESSLESQAEELRVLYVALTRAKEKAIMTGVYPLERLPQGRDGRLNFYQLEGARTYLDWILPAVLPEDGACDWSGVRGDVDERNRGNLSGRMLCPVEVRFVSAFELGFQERAEEKADQLALDVLRRWNTDRIYDPELRDQLDAQMTYHYPYENEGKMQLKFSVSELKKMAMYDPEEAQEAGEVLYPEPEVVPLIPEFVSAMEKSAGEQMEGSGEEQIEKVAGDQKKCAGEEQIGKSAGKQVERSLGEEFEKVAGDQKEGLTGASRGSAYHKLMELLDFTKDYDETLLKDYIHSQKRAGRLTEEMAACIRPGDILRFLHSSGGRRMARAAKAGKLYKEQPFVLGIDAAEIYPGDTSGEKILVQGIIDVFFEEEDGLVVLDYKTDKVWKAAELTERYHAQLEYYAQALEQLLQKPVKEKLIYSFTLKEEISL